MNEFLSLCAFLSSSIRSCVFRVPYGPKFVGLVRGSEYVFALFLDELRTLEMSLLG